MITGAQTSLPAVGLSGPNALISGRSFKPEVTAEQMNQYTFNIVPNRDIVPMLDDKADQFQYIRCEAEPYDFVACHYAKRSLCEIIYTCVSSELLKQEPKDGYTCRSNATKCIRFVVIVIAGDRQSTG